MEAALGGAQAAGRRGLLERSERVGRTRGSDRHDCPAHQVPAEERDCTFGGEKSPPSGEHRRHVGACGGATAGRLPPGLPASDDGDVSRRTRHCARRGADQRRGRRGAAGGKAGRGGQRDRGCLPGRRRVAVSLDAEVAGPRHVGRAQSSHTIDGLTNPQSFLA